MRAPGSMRGRRMKHDARAATGEPGWNDRRPPAAPRDRPRPANPSTRRRARPRSRRGDTRAIAEKSRGTDAAPSEALNDQRPPIRSDPWSRWLPAARRCLLEEADRSRRRPSPTGATERNQPLNAPQHNRDAPFVNLTFRDSSGPADRDPFGSIRGRAKAVVSGELGSENARGIGWIEPRPSDGPRATDLTPCNRLTAFQFPPTMG